MPRRPRPPLRPRPRPNPADHPVDRHAERPAMNPLVAPEAHARGHRTALSVNVNKIALLRNTRHLGIPDVVKLSRQALEAGAQGITVHPRPDARHIRSSDVDDLAAFLKDWPQAEFNIEGNPTQNLMDFVRRHKPHQVTFVPDSEDQFTSDHGWTLPQDAEWLRPLIREAQDLGVRVSLFMDPQPAAMAAVAELLAGFTATAEAALKLGLGINAGHDLNRDNLGLFLRQVPGVQEVSIGH